MNDCEKKNLRKLLILTCFLFCDEKETDESIDFMVNLYSNLGFSYKEVDFWIRQYNVDESNKTFPKVYDLRKYINMDKYSEIFLTYDEQNKVFDF